MSAKKTKTKTPKGSIRLVLSYMRPYFPLILLALLFSVIQIAATLLAPVVIGKAVDYIIGENNVDFEKILHYSFILMGLIALVMVFQWLGSLCTNKAAMNTVRDLRCAAFNKLNRVPLSYIDNRSHGDMLSRVVNDTDLISDGLIQGFTQLFSGIVTVAGTIVFMLRLNLSVTLVVVLITPVSICVAYLIARATHNMFKLQQTKRGELSGLSEEALSGVKEIKAFGREKIAEAEFDGVNEDLRKVGVKAMFYSALTNPGTRFVNAIVYAAVAVVGALMVIKSGNVGFTVGILSAFLAYANQYTKPFNEITGVVTELQTASAAAGRVKELLDETEEPSDDGLPALSYCDGSIEIEHVNFAYVPDRPLIQDLNLSVLPGRRVAIVGPTGCGKTTLINLLMRFYDPQSGRILLSDTPVTEITRNSLRGSYGMVLQDSWIFRGTVAENIAYGKPNATREEIEDAAKRAHIHSFIQKLKNGYDTVIDDEGSSISQGEKQLLCIARIMLTQPPMLILDEATSNIDTRTEHKIQSAFAAMMKGRTSFVIAHRLSTIIDADVILVMRDGNVIEQGTHAELIEKGGFYSQLYNSQFV
ncbi:ABC transporter ATP-binding protein [Pumilibacter intestinalis]|uniref:ABC transporter ATP-binding protein n=1 Tax=Pumilibacter intestinalis TaxID=2941511 RepID=UPI00203B2C7B|nr:ABC transporter ATP-binding protein [Pumilibacter intestinalis]